jgi:hypothetical protein
MNATEDLWQETRTALHTAQSVAELRTKLTELDDGADAQSMLTFLDGPGIVAEGEPMGVFHEALTRLAAIDPEARPLLQRLAEPSSALPASDGL